MLKMAIEMCQHHKIITQLELQVVMSNHRAIKLYRKLGFVVVAKTPNAVKLRDGKFYSRLHMVRKI